MQDPDDKPIIVNPSPVPEQAATGGRDLLILLGALPTIVALFGKRDAVGFVNWLASEPGLAAAGAVIAIGTVLYRQFLARKAKAVLVTIAEDATDRVAQVRK